MSAVLEVLGPLIGVVASAVGVVVAVEQLTERSRVRRTAQWTKDLGASENDPERVRVLQRLQAWATAQLAAAVLVPARYFSDAVALLVAVPAAIFGAFLIADETGERPDTVTIAVVLGTGFLALWIALGNGVRAHRERRRIALEYLNSQHVQAPDLSRYLHLRTALSPSDRLWTGMVAAGSCGLSAGVSDLIFFRPSDWASPVLILSFGAVAQGVDTLRRRSKRLSPLGDV